MGLPVLHEFPRLSFRSGRTNVRRWSRPQSSGFVHPA
jgi:hypothetical protein